MSDMVFLNGVLLPRRQAMVSVLDGGFLYGYGLFETMRAYQGRLFRLEKHLERLKRAAATLRISTENLSLEKAVREVLRGNRLGDARIRITVSCGEGDVFTADFTGRPSVLITAAPYQPPPEEVYSKGFSAVISSIPRNSRSPLSRLKTTNYLESILSKREAITAGADEALCLNEQGFLAEGSMTNIFLVKDGVLHTPDISSGILPGIARGTVMELASDLGIRVMEGDIPPEELFSAQEAFLTNSMIEVMPLTIVEGKAIGVGTPGEITVNLMEAYHQLARRGG